MEKGLQTHKGNKMTGDEFIDALDSPKEIISKAIAKVLNDDPSDEEIVEELKAIQKVKLRVGESKFKSLATSSKDFYPFVGKTKGFLEHDEDDAILRGATYYMDKETKEFIPVSDEAKERQKDFWWNPATRRAERKR